MLKKIFIRSSIGLLVATSLLFGYYFYFKYSFVEDLNYRSSVAETALGSIEYSLTGESDLVLLFIHGTPGGHDQTIEPSSYYRVLTPSRLGYLRTPLSVSKSPAEQAKAYKALLDSLGIKEVSEIYMTDFGLAIATKVDERFISSKLKECKERVIYEHAEMYYSDWLTNLREEANIEIYYDKLL